jgi:hypothetical protein
MVCLGDWEQPVLTVAVTTAARSARLRHFMAMRFMCVLSLFREMLVEVDR